MWPRRTVVRWLGSGVDTVSRRVGVGGCIALLFGFWALGLLDHLRETSMDEFVWQDHHGQHINVREEVDREVDGE